jgi:outer membrane protein OmpA-like peptidoglycan-associated protein
MDQSNVKFYKGIFHSQFVSDRQKDEKGFKSVELKLEQRFVFNVISEISLEQYEAAKESRYSTAAAKWQLISHSAYDFKPVELQPHVLLTNNNHIELVFKDGSASREICSELYVEYGQPNNNSIENTYDFTAIKDGAYHGRLTGIGFVRIPIFSDDIKEKLIVDLEQVEGKKRNGCLTPFLPRLSGWGFSGGVNGCLASPIAGCGPTGCGLIGLLFLLGLLLATWRGCQNQNGITPRVIHDTIYVDENSKKDVIKQFLDTTTIFKTEAIELPNVQFYSNSAKLLPYSINSIQQLADYLIAHPKVNAVIEGHTDNTGDPMTNLKLSQERAETVRQVLISFGVESDRVEAKGFGKNHPKADNSTLEGRAMNRRVEVRLTNTEHSETKSTEINK